MSIRMYAPLFAALAATPAFAGIVGGGVGSIDYMQTGFGHVDLETGAESIDDIVSVDDPTVGSFIFIGGGVPGAGSFLGEITFTSTVGPVARFDSVNDIDVEPFALSGDEWAFSGNRVSFTTTVPVEVNLLVDLNVEGAGLGFLEVYGDSSNPFLNPVGGTWGLNFMLAAGTHTLAWGAMAGPDGGVAEMDGFLTLTLVPTPGAVALLAMAGLVGNRRRRR